MDWFTLIQPEFSLETRPVLVLTIHHWRLIGATLAPDPAEPRRAMMMAIPMTTSHIAGLGRSARGTRAVQCPSRGSRTGVHRHAPECTTSACALNGIAAG